jgi:hypothetical protein
MGIHVRLTWNSQTTDAMPVARKFDDVHPLQNAWVVASHESDFVCSMGCAYRLYGVYLALSEPQAQSFGFVPPSATRLLDPDHERQAILGIESTKHRSTDAAHQELRSTRTPENT